MVSAADDRVAFTALSRRWTRERLSSKTDTLESLLVPALDGGDDRILTVTLALAPTPALGVVARWIDASSSAEEAAARLRITLRRLEARPAHLVNETIVDDALRDDTRNVSARLLALVVAARAPRRHPRWSVLQTRVAEGLDNVPEAWRDVALADLPVDELIDLLVGVVGLRGDASHQARILALLGAVRGQLSDEQVFLRVAGSFGRLQRAGVTALVRLLDGLSWEGLARTLDALDPQEPRRLAVLESLELWLGDRAVAGVDAQLAHALAGSVLKVALHKKDDVEALYVAARIGSHLNAEGISRAATRRLLELPKSAMTDAVRIKVIDELPRGALIAPGVDSILDAVPPSSSLPVMVHIADRIISEIRDGSLTESGSNELLGRLSRMLRIARESHGSDLGLVIREALSGVHGTRVWDRIEGTPDEAEGHKLAEALDRADEATRVRLLKTAGRSGNPAVLGVIYRGISSGRWQVDPKRPELLWSVCDAIADTCVFAISPEAVAEAVQMGEIVPLLVECSVYPSHAVECRAALAASTLARLRAASDAFALLDPTALTVALRAIVANTDFPASIVAAIEGLVVLDPGDAQEALARQARRQELGADLSRRLQSARAAVARRIPDALDVREG